MLKAQVDRRLTEARRLARGGRRFGRGDKRIEIVSADLPTDEYMGLFASAAAIVAPSRWEGLGLHLYEATALGIPIVTNDNPADERDRDRRPQRPARARDRGRRRPLRHPRLPPRRARR